MISGQPIFQHWLGKEEVKHCNEDETALSLQTGLARTLSRKMINLYVLFKALMMIFIFTL